MWKPIVKDDALKQRIEKKLAEIFEAVKGIQEENPSLLGGQAGIILFKSYYFKLAPTAYTDYDWNVQILYNYVENPTDLNYASGLAGVLHTLNHLEKENFFDFGDELKQFDYSIFNQYISKEETLDLLHGSTGVLLSLVEQNNNHDYTESINNWLEAIERKREPDEQELKWKVSLRYEDTRKEGYCLGLAHGFPSIILLLLKSHKRNPSEKISLLLSQTIHFLLNQAYDDHTEFYFPSRIIDDIKLKGMMAWCYGDLGIAFSLFMYSEHFNDPKLKSLAIEIFMHHTKTRHGDFYTVQDADFCHGTIGVAHMYARMYNYTHTEAFREASEYWYGISIEKAIYPDGLAGYKHYSGMKEGLTNEYGLLEGVSGIGLSFISAISTIEPAWDSSLLLS